MAIVIDLMPGAFAPKRAVVVDADPARASGAPTNQWVDDGMIFWVLEPCGETELLAAIERAKVYADQRGIHAVYVSPAASEVCRTH